MKDNISSAANSSQSCPERTKRERTELGNLVTEDPWRRNEASSSNDFQDTFPWLAFHFLVSCKAR